MLVEQLVNQWPTRWPRKDAWSTRNAASQVKHFAQAFPLRPVASVSREEFRRFALEHPGAARYVRTMLYDALDAGIVRENVAAGVKIPRRRKKEIVWPTYEQLLELINAAPTPRFASMIAFAAYSGLREGEQRAFAGQDLLHSPDGAYHRARVRFSVNREERLKEPKTEHSRDSIAIFAPARIYLKMAMDADEGWPVSPLRANLIWPYSHAERRGLWERTRYEAEVDVPWHSLRHYCATWLLDQGATVDDVADQLRIKASEVRKTYGHPDHERALQRLEEIVG